MSDIVSATTVRRKEKLNFRNVSQFFICLSVLLGAMFFSLFYGSVNMEFHQKLNTVISIITGSINSDDLLPYETIIYNIRLPRIILVAITGASLSLVGILMQTITRNELADPYILGVFLRCQRRGGISHCTRIICLYVALQCVYRGICRRVDIHRYYCLI